MKVKIQNFLFGKSHSWSIVTQNLARQLIKQEYNVDLISTDGVIDKFIPEDLKEYIKDKPDIVGYDACISYTAMHNFPNYLNHSKQNRFGIWCYEFPILPAGFAKYHQFCDYLLPPSKWAAQIFMDNKIPEKKVKVIPHGINLNEFDTESFKLKTKKTIKFLLPLGQPHLRKGIDLTIEAFYKAFTKDDDVVLIAKVPLKKKNDKGYNAFDVNVTEIISNLNKKYPKHPEVELITEFVPNMAALYKACDVVYSLTRAECFFIPGLEAFAANKLLIIPRHGGQLEFCSDDNCLLVDGKLEQAPAAAQYWSASVYNTWFTASIDDAVSKLKYVYENYNFILNEKQEAIKNTALKYSWENVTQDLIKLL